MDAHTKALELAKEAQIKYLDELFGNVSGHNKLNVFKQFAKTSTIEDLSNIQLNYIFDKMRIHTKSKLLPMYSKAYNQYKEEDKEDNSIADFIRDVIDIHKKRQRGQ